MPPRPDEGRALSGPCFCDKLTDEACRVINAHSDEARIVRHVACDECGMRWRQIEIRGAGE